MHENPEAYIGTQKNSGMGSGIGYIPIPEPIPEIPKIVGYIPDTLPEPEMLFLHFY